MVYVFAKYFTPFDVFFNKIKRQGFWIYTGLIIASTLYLMFSSSQLPSIPPPPPKKAPPPPPPLVRQEKSMSVESASIDGSSSSIKKENGTDDTPAHVVDGWTKRELYRFLFQHKIYPEINEEITVVRSKAISIYDQELESK